MAVQLHSETQDLMRLVQINRQNEQRLDLLKAQLSDLTRNFQAATEEKQALQVQVDEMQRQQDYRERVFAILKEQVVAVRAMERQAITQRCQLIATENWSVLRGATSVSGGGVAGALALGPIGAAVGFAAGFIFGMGSAYYAARDQSNAQVALIERIQVERATVAKSFIDQGLPAPQFEDEGRYNPPPSPYSVSDR